MSKIQPRLPGGTRDFLPEQVSGRRYILNSIKDIFHLYGFQEIETPAMENLETLTGKYGDEGDKLLFKILNSGDFLSKAPDDILKRADSQELTSYITEKGLRYDLTVPLARYVVQHQNELAFPFRRYHIGPVWRADRPQKGRYREFYQCDADIIGNTSLVNESELTRMFEEVFTALSIPVVIRMNHRKILEGIMEAANVSSLYKEILVSVDKLDKVGWEGVKKELAGLGLDSAAIDTLTGLFSATSMDELAEKFNGKSETGLLGISELKEVMEVAASEKAVFSASLARGLDYYTGTIWEVACTSIEIGTIAAGGRYDNLTEMFGGRDMSGVGISFGIERIYDVLEEMKGFPQDISSSTHVLIVNFDDEGFREGWKILVRLRQNGIPSEIYPAPVKLKKQMSYADKKNIPFVIFTGEEERKAGKVNLKDMASGNQDSLTIDEVLSRLS